MSLTPFLLGLGASTSGVPQSAHIDNELDALFRSNPRPPAASHPVETPTVPLSNAVSPKGSNTKGSKRKRASAEQLPTSGKGRSSISTRRDKKRRRSVATTDSEEVHNSEDEAENDAQLEDNYLSRRITQNAVNSPVTKDVSEVEPSDVDTDNASPLVHETHAASGPKKHRSKSHKKAKYVPPDETPAQRDARTVFVGNISVSVAKSKSSQKQLRRHFLTLVTGSKIESIRFRSVAFASATTVLPTEDTKNPKEAANLSTKQQRQHDRAAKWRGSAGSDSQNPGKKSHEEDETSDREDSHSHVKKASLTPAERKRVAFIKGEFHKEVDTVNAYIVFAHFEPCDDQESAASGREQHVHPFEAARLAVERCDGTLFMDSTIRVDRVGQWRIGVDAKSGDGGDDVGKLGDPRATLFVGNLDFAAKEEELRVWFEGVVSQERGPPPLSNAVGEGETSSEEDDEVDSQKKGTVQEKTQRWVRSVRIIRDRDTQLGKGFAYVRFSDRECVDEILGLEPSKLKFAKRKLRVQRCKAGPSPSVLATAKQQKKTTAVSPRAKKTAEATSFVPLPKGDPSLGEKLAGLSKDERKAAKAANVDRLKRRLAKKKAKEGVEKGQGGKDRKRERSRLQNKNGGKPKVVNKGRIRSDKSLAKRNTKK